MNQERDLARTHIALDAPTHDDDLAPGRGSRSSRLGAPAYPIASGLIPVQRDGAGNGLDDADVRRAARDGVSGGGSALPHLAAIQAAFGRHDISDVTAHVGGRAADAATMIGARAYAMGNSVAFTAAPDLHLAAHEAAHIVQQRGGVQLSGGVGRAGDSYEQHADAVADAVVRGGSAEPFLDRCAGRGAGGGPAVQLDRIDQQGAVAVHTLQSLIDGSDSRHFVTILQAINDALVSDPPENVTAFSIEFAYDNSYHLTVPRTSLPAIYDSCTRRCDELTHSDRPRTPHAADSTRLAQLGAGALAEVIHHFGGDVGEEQELEIEVHVPVELVAIVGHMTLTISHDDTGYGVTARPQLGLGLATEGEGHADLMTGTTFDVHGHNAFIAAQLLSLALEHELRAMATQPPPPFICAALLGISAGLGLGAGVVADVGARLYNYATTGHASDPFWLWLANRVFGSDHADMVQRGMGRDDRAETIDDADFEGGVSGEGAHHHAASRHGAQHPDLDVELGGSHHWQLEGGDGRARESEFDAIDATFHVEVEGFGIELTVQRPIHGSADGKLLHVEIKLMCNGETSEGMRVLNGEALMLALQRLQRALAEHADAVHVASTVLALHTPWESIANSARTALASHTTGPAMPTRVGVELELELDTFRNATAEWEVAVKMTYGLEGHGLGEGVSLSHSLELAHWKS